MNSNFVILDGLPGLILTSAVLIAIPGPSIMFLVGQAISAGRTNAIRSVIGNAIGMYSIAVLLAIGIGSIMLHSEVFLSIIRLIGASILLAIGIHYLLASRQKSYLEPLAKKQARPIMAGIVVGVTNPKALIMFGTIVPSFLSRNTESPISSLLIYGMVPIIIGLIIDYAWVMAAHSLSSQMISNERMMRLVNLAGGGLIVVMAITLAWKAVS